MVGASGSIRIEGATKTANSGAVAASLLLAFPATLHSLTISNTSGATRFIQLFDAAAVPADTAVPLISLNLATVTAGHWTWPQGRQFATGICVVSSSTQATKTITAADQLIDVTYRPKN